MTHLKSTNVLSSHHKLIPLTEDSLTSTLTVFFFTLPSDGSISLLLCQVKGGKTLGL